MTVYNNNNSVLFFEKQEKAAWPSDQRAELVKSGPRVPLCRALLSKVPVTFRSRKVVLYFPDLHSISKLP